MYKFKRAFSINLSGYDQINFQYDKNTEIHGSCSLQWHNHFYVFGGFNLWRQVSMVKSNRLEQKASLDFNFHLGACTVLNQQTIILCFDNVEKRVCRQSNKPLGLFTKLRDSNYDHRVIRMASFDGKSIFYRKIKNTLL